MRLKKTAFSRLGTSFQCLRHWDLDLSDAVVRLIALPHARELLSTRVKIQDGKIERAPHNRQRQQCRVRLTTGIFLIAKLHLKASGNVHQLKYYVSSKVRLEEDYRE